MTTRDEVFAQLEQTTATVGRLHEVLLARLREGDPNPHLLTGPIRALVDMELDLRALARYSFPDPPPTP